MEVTPNFKPELIPCVCGCSVVARLQAKVWKGETSAHNRGCKCRRCQGRRNRKSGLSAQRNAARALGIGELSPFLPSDEELFGGQLRVEVKSGSQCRPMDTAFRKAWGQSEAARALGDSRPIVVVAKAKPESKDGIVAFRQSDLEAVAYALATNLGMLDG